MAAGAQSDGRVGTTGMLAAEATATLQAQGQHWAGAAVDMRAGSLDLSGSQTRAGTIALQATGAGIDLAGAGLAASQELSVMSAAGLRTDGALLAGPDILLAAQSLTHRGGTLHAGRSLRVISDGLVDNSSGRMLSGGDLQVAGAQSASPRSLRVSNRDGVILATDMLRVQADSLGGDGQRLRPGNANDADGGLAKGGGNGGDGVCEHRRW
jgi:filamentous hemagglutinin